MDMAENWESMPDDSRQAVRRMVCVVIAKIPTPGRDDPKAVYMSAAIQEMMRTQTGSIKQAESVANVIGFINGLPD